MVKSVAKKKVVSITMKLSCEEANDLFAFLEDAIEKEGIDKNKILPIYESLREELISA